MLKAPGAAQVPIARETVRGVAGGAPLLHVTWMALGPVAVAVPMAGAPGAVQALTPSINITPVLPASSQFDSRVLLVPPPVHETPKRPYMSERLSPVAPHAEAPPWSWRMKRPLAS